MIALYNPLSTTPGKQPLPLSLMALAAVLEGRHPWMLVDGNIVPDPATTLINLPRASRDDVHLLAVTAMPGPQVSHAVPVCRRVRAERPDIPIVWGGYFPTQHADTVLNADYVDFVVRSQGEAALLTLIDVLRHGGDFRSVPNLSWKRGRDIIHNPVAPPTPLDELPDLPYGRVRMEAYLHRNYLGRRTVAHASSFGCPFACSFCAVVAMSNRRWLAQSPMRLERTLGHLVATYGVDAVQMHDMDFFISEARTAEFCERIERLRVSWWALGRVDTLMRYSDDTWRTMKRSGLRMVFSGVESGSDETLTRMNKGGTASTQLALDLAHRMRTYGIVPEFSFVLGSPPDPLADLNRTFAFIRTLKRINPATEIVMYVYTPVPMDGALYDSAVSAGFRFPDTLEAWASDDWRRLSMRRGDAIPWMEGKVRRRVRNFERVLNAFYPTVTDRRLTAVRRAVLRTLGAWRYRLKIHAAPYELRALQRLLRYQRPETTGF
jgi:radical SAM superfamily enzyme YgiQ (UPF0313 family)